jgi:DNA-binding CsgD family transcriptional regulator/N-acetylneuraminic acid mutarotase
MTNNETGELSERELEILRLVATGAGNKEIAQTLFISSNTVKVHLRNIFTKVGVTSRTEAAMYAVRIGLVQTPTVSVTSEDDAPTIDQPSQATTTTNLPGPRIGTWLQRWGILIVFIMVIAALGIGIMIAQLPIFDQQSRGTVEELQPSPTDIPRWQEHSALPTARSALALAVFENQIYAIGGETAEGATGIVQRYNPTSDQWTTLKSKPLAVSEVSAAVLGGKIFVPGGRTKEGNVSNALQAYDPIQNHWESFSSLPSPLSGYALITFEGQIYLFGGWDGVNYVSTVYIYDPSLDEWRTGTPMPTARALCGAALSGGQIHVIGGYTGHEVLTVNEIYLPSRDNGNDNPWEIGPSLPEGRYAMGIANVSDLIYIIGGIGEEASEQPIMELSPTSTEWQTLSASIPATWSFLGTAPLGQYLYMMGGLVEDNPTALNLSYQAIYTVVIPLVR